MKQYKKIEIFCRGRYLVTTTRAKTCKEAKANFLKTYPQFTKSKVTAHYKKGDN